jgi:hypothetical protein
LHRHRRRGVVVGWWAGLFPLDREWYCLFLEQASYRSYDLSHTPYLYDKPLFSLAVAVLRSQALPNKQTNTHLACPLNRQACARSSGETAEAARTKQMKWINANDGRSTSLKKVAR